MLARVRSLGLTKPGGTAAGLAEDFVLLTADVPQEPEDEEPGRDLPPEIMRQLCEYLPKFEEIAKTSREVRVAVELAIDTGRRPDDICELPWNCLDRDDNGDPVLVYDNHKRNRLGRRLPIPEATAELITGQKKRVRERFPDTSIAELKLLPSNRKNPDGRRPIGDSSMSERHRIWVNNLPPLRLADGTEFDKAQVVPYAYRHTFVISPDLHRVGHVGDRGGRARASRISGTCRHRWIRSPRGRVDQHWVPGRAGSVTARRRRVVGGTRR